jgi:Ca-activated chloride channel family protein
MVSRFRERSSKPDASAAQSKPASRRSGDLKLTLLLAVVVLAPVVFLLSWQLGGAGKFTLARPWALLLLLAVPLAVWVQLVVGRRRRAAFAFSSTSLLSRLRRGPAALLEPLPPILRIVALTLIVVALSRPQTRDRASRVVVDGIDIMLALDLSQSMEARDLFPSRLEAAKRVIDDFIKRRRTDRIGLVVFGKDAYTQCPLTLDYSVLRNMLAELRIGLINGRATAIGNALGVSLARLRNSDAKSRVVILLTDGDNNAGNVTPKQAARYASAMKVKVFTVLMGPSTATVSGGRDAFGRPIRLQRHSAVNPKLLREIAAATGGQAYLATDRRGLEQGFEKILAELEKSTRRDVAAIYTDAYRSFLLLALLLLFIEAALRLTRFREFP